MLPEPDNPPAEGAEAAKVALVAGAIGVELVPPELRELLFPRGSRQPCQKSPSTKTATRSLGKTMSGRPGGVRTWQRKRSPFARSSRCTSFSSDPSLDFTRWISGGDATLQAVPARNRNRFVRAQQPPIQKSNPHDVSHRRCRSALRQRTLRATITTHQLLLRSLAPACPRPRSPSGR